MAECTVKVDELLLWICIFIRINILVTITKVHEFNGHEFNGIHEFNGKKCHDGAFYVVNRIF